MSTKAVHESHDENLTLSQRISQFVGKNRVVIISVLAVIACAFAVFLAVTLITDSKNKSAFDAIETAAESWDTARTATDKTGLAAKEDELLATLLKLAAANKRSYAGARAYTTIAEIYYSRKDWANAEVNYKAAAEAAPKAYTAGLAYYNAAMSADEQGKADEAIGFFKKASESDTFRFKPRALFNIGRIEEQRSKVAEAITAYEKLASDYPDEDWTKLAKSRLIVLKAK